MQHWICFLIEETFPSNLAQGAGFYLYATLDIFSHRRNFSLQFQQGRDFSVYKRKSVFGIACELKMWRKKIAFKQKKLHQNRLIRSKVMMY